MRRADRLFQIIQHLHHDRVITARDLSENLAVSERTIYRDIQDLSLSGVPITGDGSEFIPSFLRVSNGNATTGEAPDGASGLCLTCHLK